MTFYPNRHLFRFIKIHSKLYSSKVRSNLLKVLTSMPKEPKHIAGAQKQRNKIKEKFSKYVSGRVTLQVLGTGAKGAPRALYMFSDQSRYLFNCGEGTQRLAHEHKMKLAKLEHIFITQPVWKNIGGLPGTALTIQDVGVPQITLHGPPGLEEIFVATKRFVVIRDLKIKMAECSENSIFEDNVMKVTYVPISRSETKMDSISEENESFEDNENNQGVQVGSSEMSDAQTSTKKEGTRRRRSRSKTREEIFVDDTDYYAHEQSGNRTSPGGISLETQEILTQTKEKGVSMCFICRLQPRPGALNLDKCVKLGVPPGPLLGKIKAGQDVTLPNGTVVTSKDVCEPDDPGPVFLVVDCPSEEYLDSLISNETFIRYNKYATNDEDCAYLVIHFTPKNIMDNPRYKEWMDDFSPSTHHIILNEGNKCMGSLSVHRIQQKLNLLSEEFFPLLGDKGTEVIDVPSHKHVNKKLKSDDQTETKPQNLPMENLSMEPPSYNNANTFLNFHLRPKKGMDRSAELKIVPSEYIEETMSIDQFPQVLQDFKKEWATGKLELCSKTSIRPYPKILFLGTGSCIPNKTRNTSGILLETEENKNFLLDCGEGTCGQLIRFYGKDKADSVLANIDAIYVSHLHADHHIGLLGVLQGRRKAIDNLGLEKGPVYLFAPKQILAWLQFYDRFFENIRTEFQLIPNGDLLSSLNIKESAGHVQFLNDLDMDKITTCYVRHCPNAFGVSLMHKSGYKITYSGDTMPADALIEIGKDSDLLIHEATMEDDLAQEAVVKLHSTTSQAIEVGKKMNAKHILLTHFSQRYAKLPRFNDNFAANVGIAFDNMHIRLDELPLVPILYPALKLMFAEHYEELEHKAVKRQMKIEREREASLERKQVIK